MEKVFALDYEMNDEGYIHHLIGMEAEAKRVFFNWHNNTIERINAIRDENLVESRPMKSPVQVARLALILQVLSYACGESHLQFVTTTAIEGAIRLNDYFEGSYRRIREYVANDACDGQHITVNGRTAKASYDVKGGDVIEIAFGQRTVKVEVLAVTENAKKDDAAAMYRELAE